MAQGALTSSMREIKLLLEGRQSINLSGDDNSSKDCRWGVKAITGPQQKISQRIYT